MTALRGATRRNKKRREGIRTLYYGRNYSDSIKIERTCNQNATCSMLHIKPQFMNIAEKRDPSVTRKRLRNEMIYPWNGTLVRNLMTAGKCRTFLADCRDRWTINITVQGSGARLRSSKQQSQHLYPPRHKAPRIQVTRLEWQHGWTNVLHLSVTRKSLGSEG